MTTSRFSRRDMLVGAGAATLVGLTACDHAGSSMVSGPSGFLAGVSPSRVGHPNVIVSTPTGAAIQAAIDGLGPSGGTVYLNASAPYVISQTLVISTNHVTLVGKGSGATSLLAQKGAVLTTGSSSVEYLLLVQGATNTSILDLEINTANQANSSGNPRIGIGVWNSDTVKVNRVKFVKNLGPNGYNQSLSFNATSHITVDQCTVNETRTGIALSQSSNFTINSCTISGCEAETSVYTGTIAGIAVLSSTTGVVKSCDLLKNAVLGSVFISDGAGVLINSCKISETMPFPTQGNNGVLIENSTRGPVVVKRCSIVRNSAAGMSVSGSSGVTVKQCTLVNNGSPSKGGGGVELNGGTANVMLTGNQISDNRHPSYAGIAAGNSATADTGAQITSNSVHGFGTGVVLGSNSQSCLVEYNNLTLNTACVTNNGTGNTVVNNQC